MEDVLSRGSMGQSYRDGGEIGGEHGCHKIQDEWVGDGRQRVKWSLDHTITNQVYS